MKNIFIVLIFISIKILAQEFTVEKVSGVVQVMSGTSEEWIKVKTGQKLNGNDLIATDDKSFIQLMNKGSRFILQGNSALELSAIKKITLNELLLALAMEEIRNVPKSNGNQTTRNTAVYGKEVTVNKISPLTARDLGFKKLNGAKQLAQSGYKESALIVAKEIYRKYPETKLNIDDRLYFVDLLMQLNLMNEAETDLNKIKNMKLNPDESVKVTMRLNKIKELSVKN